MATKKSKDPEIEIKAKMTGAEEWKTSSKDWDKYKNKNYNSSHGTAGALYFVGIIGALIYWWQAAHIFGAVITGFLKAMVWPAYIVYKLLEMFYGRVHF